MNGEFALQSMVNFFIKIILNHVKFTAKQIDY